MDDEHLLILGAVGLGFGLMILYGGVGLNKLIDQLTRRHGRLPAEHLNTQLSYPIDRDAEFSTDPEEDEVNFDLRDGQKVLATIAPIDRDGNAATIQPGSASWSSDRPDLVAVSQLSELEASLSTVPGPGLGIANVTVTADADLGDGVRSITETLVINVVAGDVSALGITIGPEEPRDGAPPVEPPAEPPVEPPADGGI